MLGFAYPNFALYLWWPFLFASRRENFRFGYLVFRLFRGFPRFPVVYFLALFALLWASAVFPGWHRNLSISFFGRHFLSTCGRHLSSIFFSVIFRRYFVFVFLRYFFEDFYQSICCRLIPLFDDALGMVGLRLRAPLCPSWILTTHVPPPRSAGSVALVAAPVWGGGGGWRCRFLLA